MKMTTISQGELLLLGSDAIRSVLPLTLVATCRRDLLDSQDGQALPSTPLSVASTNSEGAYMPSSQYISPSSANALNPGSGASSPRQRAASLPYNYGPGGVDQDNFPQSHWLAGEPPQNIKRVDVRTHAQPQPCTPP